MRDIMLGIGIYWTLLSLMSFILNDPFFNETAPSQVEPWVRWAQAYTLISGLLLIIFAPAKKKDVSKKFKLPKELKDFFKNVEK